jgi:hypothetical protein
MIVYKNDLYMTRGDSDSITVSVLNTDGSPLSFSTGDKIYFTVKEQLNTQNISIQKIVTEFDEQGRAIIEIGHNDTMNLPIKSYFYDIQ